MADRDLYTGVENQLEIIKVKFKVFEKEKSKSVWEPLGQEESKEFREPLHMTVRMAGGTGSLIAGKPGQCPEGFTWQVRKIPQKQPDRRKRVEKWTGLRLRKSKKKEKEEEIYGGSGDENRDDDDQDKKKHCKKPSEWKKSQPILTLRGMFGARKPGDYDQMSLLKDPTSFKYVEDLEQAGLGNQLKKNRNKKGQEEVRGREMVGPDGQIWPYGGMGAPWYQGPLCHPECTCLLPGWENPDTASKEYKLVKKLFDVVNSPQGPTGQNQDAAGRVQRCRDEDIDVCEKSKEEQQEILNEIGEEILKMMIASRPKPSRKSRRRCKKSAPSLSASSEEGNFAYDEGDCVGEVCRLRAQELTENTSETGKASRKRSRCSRKRSD